MPRKIGDEDKELAVSGDPRQMTRADQIIWDWMTRLLIRGMLYNLFEIHSTLKENNIDGILTLHGLGKLAPHDTTVTALSSTLLNLWRVGKIERWHTGIFGMSGRPTGATWRLPNDGIVLIDQDDEDAPIVRNI